MADSPSARSLARIARDHGLTPAELLKAVRGRQRKPVSDRMNVGEG